MCQKYLHKISKGDKRVFLINGKVCGAISRVPKKGSFLSNMSKGAKPIKTKLTKIENKISKIIAKDLKKENISGIVHLVGDKKISMYELAKLTTPEIQPMTMNDYVGPQLTVDMSLDTNRWKQYRLK